MAGHSKWSNIKHKKEKADAQRASVFTKMGREIAIAVREGGADPSANSRLEALISKAKSNNVPNENIERVIKKASGGDADKYERVFYEGYGAGGVAVIVETATDNRNRTAADMRHNFDKYGGNLGTTGCVSFMFSDKGVIVIEGQNVKDEDKLMEDALECGGDDILFPPRGGDIAADEIFFEIYTDPQTLNEVRRKLGELGYEMLSAEVEKIPSTRVAVNDEEILLKFNKMLGVLEDNDDVQNVWHNLED